MTSHYIMMTNKLYLDDRNNDYIVLCKLGSHTISGCRVTGVGPPEPPPPPRSWEAKRKPGLNRIKTDKVVGIVLTALYFVLLINFGSLNMFKPL